jgi:hypothetical protein
VGTLLSQRIRSQLHRRALVTTLQRLTSLRARVTRSTNNANDNDEDDDDDDELSQSHATNSVCFFSF